MMSEWFGRRQTIEVPCTIRVEHSFDFLNAHLELHDNVAPGPGDEVIVHGDPIYVPFGEKAVIKRRATVKRAHPVERAWTRMTGDAEFMELLEFSFSGEQKL